MLKNYLVSVKEKLISLWTKFVFNKSKFNVILDLAIIILFFLTIFSVPTFSFLTGKEIITWIFTGSTIVLMLISCICFYGFKFNFISLSFILFAICTVISSGITGFIAFKFTPLLLVLVTLCFYTYGICNTRERSKLIVAGYIGLVLFMLVYMIKYAKPLFTLNFYRLGGLFGDLNDISIFFGLGYTISLYIALFKSKSLTVRILSIIASVLFIFTGFSTGSRIFILTFFVISFLLFLFWAKPKKKWIVLVGTVAAIGLFILMLQLPFMANIKERINSFIAAFAGKRIDGESGDGSTYLRMDMFLDGLFLFFRRPIFGYGVNGFRNFGNINPGWSHNQFSESLCNYGLIGSFFFHFGFVASFIYFIKNKKDRTLILPLIISIFFIISMFGVALDCEKIYSYFIGIVIAYSQAEFEIFKIPAFKIKKKKVLANEGC